MSGRSRVPENRAEQNRQTLKSLVKLEANKSCADCKRNKHPRWASWNLGVFVCIRCSGIHRSMGVHISRVKSVDLDSWTDEQTQNMLKWGNSRANKYWEAKLAPGHVPSEAKIENFIRTKYESKRWVMDGPMPDPATLDTEGDDDVPLNLVKEQVKLERSTSQKLAGSPARRAPGASRVTPAIDLIGGDEPPARPSTGPPTTRAPPPKSEAAPPKATKPGDSLLGLDFFAPSPSGAPARPSTTTTSGSSLPSRPDLKQSILSLYASAPKAPAQAAPQPAQSTNLLGLQASQTPQSQASSGLGGLDDAFGGLSFGPSAAPAVPKQSPFAGLDTMTQSPTSAAPPSKTSFGGGGNFFNAHTPAATQPAPQPPAAQRTFSSSSGFGDFFSSTLPETPAAQPAPATQTPQHHNNDLFDLGFDAPIPSTTAPVNPVAPTPAINSAFNLSKPHQPSQPAVASKSTTSNNTLPGLSNNFDAWGSSDVWGSEPTTAPAKLSPAPAISSGFGWASNSTGLTPSAAKTTPPKISADEDFGGWSTAPPAAAVPHAAPTATNTAPKPVTSFNSDDLFSNVWE